MLERLERLLHLAALSPVTGLYLLLGAGAAVENVFPPVPSDTFVLVGGILADRGVLEPGLVLGVVWTANVAGALVVYAMARRYGRGIFSTRWGHWLLRPHQLDQLQKFYGRYGLAAIFGSRFLPVFRVLVPAFAGITGLGFWRTALPLSVASALWYAGMVYAGVLASRNLPRILDLLGLVNNWLLAAATVAAVAVAVWWWISRRGRREQAHAESAAEAEAEGRWSEEPSDAQETDRP